MPGRAASAVLPCPQALPRPIARFAERRSGWRSTISSSRDIAFANDNPPPARNAVLARYRQLREISKRHHHDILKLNSGDAMLSGSVAAIAWNAWA